MSLDLRPPRPAFGFIDCEIIPQVGEPFTAQLAEVAPGMGANIEAEASVLDRPRFCAWAADTAWTENVALAVGDSFVWGEKTFSVDRVDDTDTELPQYVVTERG